MKKFMDDLKFHLEHFCEVMFGTVDVCNNGEEVVICISNNTYPSDVRMIEMECINFTKSYGGYKVTEINENPVEIIIEKNGS